MTLRLAPPLASPALLLWLCCCCACRAAPLLPPEGSGSEEAELELLLPASFSTRGPAQRLTAHTAAPELGVVGGGLATTVIRLKDFVLSRLVDFLQENLLVVLVVASLLIVLVFIVCCAAAMSHKRKLEAKKPPPPHPHHPSRKHQTVTDQVLDRPTFSSVDHVKRVQAQGSASPKHLRTPSKALVGERGRDVKVRKAREVREVPEAQEVREVREAREAKQSEQSRMRDQAKSGSSSGSGQPVCTCHLKKAHH